MKYIFLCGTEHHLVQLNATITHFKIPPTDTILLFIENPGEDISKKLEKYQHLSEVRVFDKWVFKDLIFKRAKHKKFVSFIKNLNKKNEQFILFSTVSHDVNLLTRSIINVEKLYLMDDGLGHFTNYWFFKSPKRWFYIFKLSIKSFFYRKYLNFNQDFIYFTEHDFIVKNSKRSEKYSIEKINNPLMELVNNEVMFLGSCLIEGKLMKYENYMTILSSVKKIFKQDKIFYFPHRRETELELRNIESLGFIINKLDEPFESFFAKLDKCSSTICSLYTTAVIQNIALRFNNKPNLKVIKFNDDLLLNSKREYKAIYTQLKSITEIEIIDLNYNQLSN